MIVADLSEFQQNLDAPAYLQAGHSCVIVRAHNGWRPDRIWPARRDYVRRFPFACVGYYQYLVAGRPAADQAANFVSAVGPLRPNEFVALDLEEGSGNQAPRAREWFHVVDERYRRPSALYSGESFGRTNLGGWAQWASRPRWIAAYQRTAPPDPHELWQNTDRFPFPGIGACDGSIFNGSAQDYARIFAHHTPISAPVTPLPKPTGVRENVIAIALTKDDRVVMAYEAEDGEVLRTWEHPDGSFVGGEKGKRHAGWQSLGHPQKERI